MSAWIAAAAYLIGMGLTYRRAYVICWEKAREHNIRMYTSPSIKYGPIDHIDSTVPALFAALLWPVVLPLILLTPTPPTLARERADAALREREAEIARMERELGIGDNRHPWSAR